MAKLPILNAANQTLEAIDHAVEAGAGDWRRDHLGASLIGRPCERAIWYTFRWFSNPKFAGRILRLFRRGQREELTAIADLRGAGLTVSEGPAPGEQWRFSYHGGHFGGSIDGAVLGVLEAPKTWHILEIKTHNKRSFDALVRDGVEKSKPEHYAQLQVYMLKMSPPLTRGLYDAVCKNDDQRYLERVHLDSQFAFELTEKAARIIFSAEPPERISERPDYYLCKWCDHYRTCHQGDAPEISCRTCTYSSAQKEGGWGCRLWKKELDSTAQREGCADWIAIT